MKAQIRTNSIFENQCGSREHREISLIGKVAIFPDFPEEFQVYL